DRGQVPFLEVQSVTDHEEDACPITCGDYLLRGQRVVREWLFAQNVDAVLGSQNDLVSVRRIDADDVDRIHLPGRQQVLVLLEGVCRHAVVGGENSPLLRVTGNDRH